MSPMRNHMREDNKMMTVWLGIAIGTAIGLGIVVSRTRKKDRWASARDITRKFADRSGDFAEKSKDIIDRAQHIYQEGRQIVEEAAEMWGQGRRLAKA